MKTLFIDLREESELLDVQIVSNNPTVEVVNIPPRSIFANVDYITNLLNRYDKIYLICRTGRKSDVVKLQYFEGDNRIISYEGGWKKLEKEDNNSNGIEVHRRYSIFNLAPQQYMQVVIVLFLISTIVLNSYYRLDRMYMSIYISVMALFIMYQVLTKDCLMTNMIGLSD